MAAAIAIEDMRSVAPVTCIGAPGLRPEDSFGIGPSFEHSAIYFAWRKR
jgi:hypothetical protein